MNTEATGTDVRVIGSIESSGRCDLLRIAYDDYTLVYALYAGSMTGTDAIRHAIVGTEKSLMVSINGMYGTTSVKGDRNIKGDKDKGVPEYRTLGYEFEKRRDPDKKMDHALIFMRDCYVSPTERPRSYYIVPDHVERLTAHKTQNSANFYTHPEVIPGLGFRIKHIVDLYVLPDWYAYIVAEGFATNLLRLCQPGKQSGGIDVIHISHEKEKWHRIIQNGLATRRLAFRSASL